MKTKSLQSLREEIKERTASKKFGKLTENNNDPDDLRCMVTVSQFINALKGLDADDEVEVTLDSKTPRMMVLRFFLGDPVLLEAKK